MSSIIWRLAQCYRRNISTSYTLIRNWVPSFVRDSSISKSSYNKHNLNIRRIIKPSFKNLLLGVSLVASKRELPKADVEDNLAHLIILAKLALEKGDIERAEGILEMGLQISDENKVYTGVPYLYDLLASIAFVDGRIKRAETILVNAIEKLLQVGMEETDNHIVDFKLRLARVYSEYEDNRMAEIGFQNCLESATKKINSGDTTTKTGMLYVNTLFWYGIHLLKTGRLVEAKQMLDNAYGYSMKIKGLSALQEMVILVTLSDLYSQLGEKERALQYMLNAILLGKGISSTDLPRCYYKLGVIYMQLEATEQAKAAAEEGLRLVKVLGGLDTRFDLEELLSDLKKDKGGK